MADPNDRYDFDWDDVPEIEFGEALDARTFWETYFAGYKAEWIGRITSARRFRALDEPIVEKEERRHREVALPPEILDWLAYAKKGKPVSRPTEALALRGTGGVGPTSGLWPKAESIRKFHKIFDKIERTLTEAPVSIIYAARELYLETIDRQFESEGEPTWQHLDEDYSGISRLARTYPILQVTGSLRSALTNPGDPNYVERIGVDALGNAGISFGTRDARFLVHQMGTESVPARPMWPEGAGLVNFRKRLRNEGVRIIQEMSLRAV